MLHTDGDDESSLWSSVPKAHRRSASQPYGRPNARADDRNMDCSVSERAADTPLIPLTYSIFKLDPVYMTLS